MTDEAGRIADLLRKGCDGGDSVSCALAAREPALVQRELQEASAAGKKAPRSDAAVRWYWGATASMHYPSGAIVTRSPSLSRASK